MQRRQKNNSLRVALVLGLLLVTLALAVALGVVLSQQNIAGVADGSHVPFAWADFSGYLRVPTRKDKR